MRGLQRHRASRYFGCEAAMAATDANVASRGTCIAYRHPVGKSWQSDPAAVAAIDEADMIPVNGEGTIHHGKPTARNPARLGRIAGRPASHASSSMRHSRQTIRQS
jgi:hypothetical protein